jgi:hypothetical protein
LNCSNNNISDLPDFPDSLRELFCRGNPFTDECIQKILDFYEKETTIAYYAESGLNLEDELNYYTRYLRKVVKKTFEKVGDKEYINPDTQLRTDINLPDRPVYKILEYANLTDPPPPPNTGGNKKSKTLKKQKKGTKKTKKRIKTIKKTKTKNKTLKHKK